MYIRDDIHDMTYSLHNRHDVGHVYDSLLESGNFVGSTSVPMIRKACLEYVGGFDVIMRSAQDYELYLRIAKRYEVNAIKDFCVIYHVHEGARISTVSPQT